jgi:uncharacterized protein (DUF952 family)
MNYLFHIISQMQWEKAQVTGTYQPDSLQNDGFIHLSTEEQVLFVANQFYHGRSNLLLLKIDPRKLKAEVILESPIHPKPLETTQVQPFSQFPHLYGELNLDAVVSATPLLWDQSGKFTNLSIN